MKIGSLFSGAGGLDMAVEALFGGHTVWHSEIDPAASKVLTHRWPGVPNLGDITKVDWADVPAVDILCGGFPCQDVSTAASNRRAGMRQGNRSGLWSHMVSVIEQLQPSTVVIENVKGLLSATAHRNMEQPDADVDKLRAAGAVFGDLADLGFDAFWSTTSADAVGAPHGRQRVFILAVRSGEKPPQIQPCSYPQLDERPVALLPTPSASDVTGGSCDPAIRVEQGHHLQLIDVVRAFGTPAWDAYAEAISRWEELTRPAPPAAVRSRAGNPNLNPDFAEWMMGWPDAWTFIPDQIALFGNDDGLLTRNERLKLFGNGVVPQQAQLTITALSEIASCQAES
jgi:DNA (cytosine-5)-methyltransferase 1